MLRFVAAFALLLLSPADAQVWRSGGLDATTSDCHGLTCSWASGDPVHEHIAGYEFYLDPVPDDSPGSLVVRRRGRRLLDTGLKDISASVTITCAAGCKTFAVTWSDGGAIGGFHTRVFRLVAGAFVEVDSTGPAFRNFKSRHFCKSRGDNLQAWRFEGAGTDLMLILSVYPTGDCGRQMGYTEGALVRVNDGKILRRLSSSKLEDYMKRFPEGE